MNILRLVKVIFLFAAVSVLFAAAARMSLAKVSVKFIKSFLRGYL